MSSPEKIKHPTLQRPVVSSVDSDCPGAHYVKIEEALIDGSTKITRYNFYCSLEARRVNWCL
jgi:hypothetical protein